MNEQVKIFAIPGSLRPNSSNVNILRLLASLGDETVAVTLYQGLADIPPFDPSLDTDPAPKAVALLREQLSNADGILICTPEYAFGVPGVLKNALDWTVSSGSFDGKTVGLITASSLGDKAHASLLLTLTALSADVPPGASLLIPFIRSRMNEKGEVTDRQTVEQLQNLYRAFLDRTRERKMLREASSE